MTKWHMDAETMNTYKPFVSDDLVNECLKALKKVWRHTEYEQLLEEAEVKANMKVEREATVNIQLRFEAVARWLTQFEAAAGDNKDWWEQWRKDEDKDDPLIIDPYSNIDIEWYQRNITAFKLNAAVKFSIYLLKDAERPWNEADRAVFVSSYLIQLCYTVCECLGIDRLLSPGGDLHVWVHVKALCLYIALRNELNKLTKEAEHYRIPLGKETKQQVDEGEWRKGWIDLCFTEAENVKWIKHNGENKYEWTFGNPKNASLAYFVKRMLDPDDRRIKPKWEPWEKLFGITNLSQSAAQVKTQDWTETIDHFFDRVKEMRSKD